MIRLERGWLVKQLYYYVYKKFALPVFYIPHIITLKYIYIQPWYSGVFYLKLGVVQLVKWRRSNNRLSVQSPVWKGVFRNLVVSGELFLLRFVEPLPIFPQSFTSHRASLGTSQNRKKCRGLILSIIIICYGCR